jgi:hypothetical protein
MSRGPVAAVALLFTVALWPVQASVGDKLTEANETAAIVSLKVISAGQISYRLTCGNGGYAPTLAALAAPPGGSGEGFIDKTLGSSATPQKSGFSFSMAAGAGSAKGPKDCNGAQTVTKFYASATPLSAKTGTRSFAVNQNDIIWTLKGSKAPTEPFGPPAQQIGVK